MLTMLRMVLNTFLALIKAWGRTLFMEVWAQMMGLAFSARSRLGRLKPGGEAD